VTDECADELEQAETGDLRGWTPGTTEHREQAPERWQSAPRSSKRRAQARLPRVTAQPWPQTRQANREVGHSRHTRPGTAPATGTRRVTCLPHPQPMPTRRPPPGQRPRTDVSPGSNTRCPLPTCPASRAQPAPADAYQLEHEPSARGGPEQGTTRPDQASVWGPHPRPGLRQACELDRAGAWTVAHRSGSGVPQGCSGPAQRGQHSAPGDEVGLGLADVGDADHRVGVGHGARAWSTRAAIGRGTWCGQQRKAGQASRELISRTRFGTMTTQETRRRVTERSATREAVSPCQVESGAEWRRWAGNTRLPAHPGEPPPLRVAVPRGSAQQTGVEPARQATEEHAQFRNAGTDSAAV
jgi:hypothetical protein